MFRCKIAGPILGLIVLTALLACSSCLSISEKDLNQKFYGYFLRDVKTMQDMGLPVYWLGDGFDVGGVRFQGPYGSGFEVDGGGAQVGYTAWLGTPFEGSNPNLDLTVYSPDAWQRAEKIVLTPPPHPAIPSPYEVTRREVTVDGQAAEMITRPGPDQPVRRIDIVIRRDPVVVVAEVNRVITHDQALDSQLNYLVNNPDQLVQVLQGLRPYPQ